MRGADQGQSSMFTYISAERRAPTNDPLQAIGTMANGAKELGPTFCPIYSVRERPSIAREKLWRKLLLRVLLYGGQRATVDEATRLQPRSNL
jgi:hypothetical protein